VLGACPGDGHAPPWGPVFPGTLKDCSNSCSISAWMSSTRHAVTPPIFTDEENVHFGRLPTMSNDLPVCAEERWEDEQSLLLGYFAS
jgi:hypothetical protein